jgi:hypothetical protein
VALQHLIHKMARENPSWGEERIANEMPILGFVRRQDFRVAPRVRIPPGQSSKPAALAAAGWSATSRGAARLRPH